MFRLSVWVLCLGVSVVTLHAQPQQTFSASPNAPIPDNNTWEYYPLQVSGLHNNQINTNWGFEKITLTIYHTWVSDLEVWLGAPDGTQVLLFTNVGGDGDNFINTAFKKNYTTPIESGSAPFTGNYRPMGDLGLLNNGQNGNGTWYLKIIDSYPFSDQGTLVSWSIRFGNAPAVPDQPFTTRLPIIKINTFGAGIPDEPKINAEIFIIDNANQINRPTDTLYAYRGRIGIEQRGSSSAWAPKKSYGFEIWDTNNQDIDTPLLGMPAESDWILNAHYFDKTLMRNVLAYHIANCTGHYASRTRFCELFINNQYQGVYVLMEKIKRNKNRVNIAKLTPNDNAGDALTGGYILKIDKFTGNGGDGFYSQYPPSNPTNDAIFFQYDYPSDVNITPAQKAYIQNYVDSFEHALYGPNFQHITNGFRKYADELSFIDYLILNEVSKNVDGYRLSTYIHKDRQSKGGKLIAGPAWDYDIAFFNADYCEAYLTTGWAYDFNYVCPGSAVPAWWERMRQDTLFNARLRCRWHYLRSGVLHIDTLFAFIDTTVAYIDSAQRRNFQLWNIIGVPTWPQPTPLPQSYAEEIQRLKWWLQQRIAWLDQQIYQMPATSLAVTLGYDTALCPGQYLTLHPGAFHSYTWSNGFKAPQLTIQQPGVYSVTVSDAFNCTGSASIDIHYLSAPDAMFTIQQISSTSFQFIPADTTVESQWNFGDGTVGFGQAPVHDYAPQYGVFTVTHTVTDKHGCTNTHTSTVTVTPVYTQSLSPDKFISVYPNPAWDMITIASNSTIKDIVLVDPSGRAIVLKENVQQATCHLPLQNISQGLYTLHITLSDSNTFHRLIFKM
ncbi:MAG: CotH kinase family protein [Chitinophagales bacterium]|nr:CotH kinase family protein [Chitinophagales bacterium]MDW8418874.1 CotH kinase family protein [Chitinophagales bacterium]